MPGWPWCWPCCSAAPSGLHLHDKEVFAATVGGIRVVEPAADLAVALAVASAGLNLALAADLVAIGEVGLTGEVRRVGAVPRRLAEAARLGFRYALVPPGCGPEVDRHGRQRHGRIVTKSTELQGAPCTGRGPGLRSVGTVDCARADRSRHHAGVTAMLGGDPLRATLARVAPGTPLRDSLERILRGRTGALIVLGYDKIVESLCTGGFPLDVEFSATRLRELCKMDGAVVLSTDGTRIVRAAVHLMPDPSIPTEESGTRHRTAERVAKQTGYPVISVSQSMHIIGLYVSGPAARARRLRPDPVPGQPGAGHAGALQAAPRRGQRHALRAGDRGPGHRARRGRGGAAAGDGPPDRRRDRRLRRRARHRRPAARRCSSTS